MLLRDFVGSSFCLEKCVDCSYIYVGGKEVCWWCWSAPEIFLDLDDGGYRGVD